MMLILKCVHYSVTSDITNSGLDAIIFDLKEVLDY